jgi:putative DNA primase/helicase
MYRRAASLPEERDRQALIRHALATENRAARLDAMVSLARSMLTVQPEELDSDPWLLNVENGTLDLRTGQLLEHDYSQFITCLAPVRFDEWAGCPTWGRFVNTIFDNDLQVIGFVQELLGYCLTGDTREHILPIFYGTGANGKTTLVNTVQDMLGEDYAIASPRDLLMASSANSHPTALATLFGKRVVSCQESAQGARLDEALVKQATGGDSIRARRMREDFWQFQPTHKLFLITNHKPEVRGTDEGIWRRIRLVPFTVRIPDDKQDKTLPDKLRAELPGILNWCLEGCLRWQKRGLSLPPAVQAGTAEYRLQQDVLGQFLAERCLTGEGHRCRAGQLFTAWGEWCKRNGEHEGTQRRFGQAMTERGFQRQGSNGIWYLDVELLNELDDLGGDPAG